MNFTIAAAQIAVRRGDVAGNVAAHTEAIVAAAAAGASLVVFPELSLTGYEPDLAASLAFTADDVRLADLQHLAARHQITLSVGAPVRNPSAGSDGEAVGKPAIGAFVISPAGIRTYLKMHLGTTEAPYFSTGETPLMVQIADQRCGIAICADSSRASHPETYSDLGAGIYAAGVFFNDAWYGEDAPRLQRYAAELGMLVVMANHGASTGTLVSAGGSTIWAPGGEVLAQANGTDSALVMATKTADRWQGSVRTIEPVLGFSGA